MTAPASSAQRGTDPVAGVDPGGRVTALTAGVSNTENTPPSLFGNDFDGSSWSAPAELGHDSELGFENQNHPDKDLAVGAGGDAAAVWSKCEFSTGVCQIWGAFRPGGGGWSAPQMISDETLTANEIMYATVPVAAVDGDGNATIAWDRQVKHFGSWVSDSIMTRTRSADGTLGAETELASVDRTTSPDRFLDVRVTDDAAGDAAVAWMKLTPGSVIEAFASTRPSGGTWAAAQSLSGPRSWNEGHQLDVRMDAAGRATALWTLDGGTDDDGFDTVTPKSRTQAADGSWLAEQALPVHRVSSFSGVGDNIDFAEDDAGDVLVAWGEYTPDGNSVLKAAPRAAGASSWPSGETLDDSLTGRPSVSMNAAGDAVVAWQHSRWDDEQFTDRYTVKADVRPAGGSFQGVDQVLPETYGYENVAGLIDGDGMATVIADSPDSNGYARLVASHTDAVAPTIAISAPADGAHYGQGQPLAADYSCDDPSPGSGVASCDGDVADGVAVDTSSPGVHAFTVHATDGAGNVAAPQTVTYTVDASSSPDDGSPSDASQNGGGSGDGGHTGGPGGESPQPGGGTMGQQGATGTTGPSAAELQAAFEVAIEQATKMAAAIAKGMGDLKKFVDGITIALSGNAGDRVEAGVFMPAGRHAKLASASRKRRPVVLARGVVRFKHAGERKLKIRLTRAGRRTLKKAKKLKVTLRITYTPAGGAPVTRYKRVTLKHKKRRKRHRHY